MRTATETNEILQKIVFKDYYEGLNDEDKETLVFALVPKYLSISSFYRKKNDNSFSELEFEKIETITKLNFVRPCSDL